MTVSLVALTSATATNPTPGTTTPTLTIAVPSGLAEDDRVYLVAQASFTVDTANITMPSSFDFGVDNNGSSRQRVKLVGKKQGATPDSGSYTITGTTRITAIRALCWAIRGIPATEPDQVVTSGRVRNAPGPFESSNQILTWGLSGTNGIGTATDQPYMILTAFAGRGSSITAVTDTNFTDVGTVTQSALGPFGTETYVLNVHHWLQVPTGTTISDVIATTDLGAATGQPGTGILIAIPVPEDTPPPPTPTLLWLPLLMG